jgi:hypothetical protein
VGKTKDIREAVETELDFDPLIDDGDISVKNMSGEVALEVVLPSESYRDDATLTTMADNAPAANISVPATVDAIAGNGNIMLSGTVRYGSERAAAERSVAWLTGVRNIQDEIDIAWDADPADVALSVQEALAQPAYLLP